MDEKTMLESSASTPTPQNYLRSIVLFGRNVASYKFALAESLIELAGQGRASLTLEELAVPYARHLFDRFSGCGRQPRPCHRQSPWTVPSGNRWHREL
jgi:hypothetical protein